MRSGTGGNSAAATSASLLQHLITSGSSIPEQSRKVLASFIQESTGGLALGPTPSQQEVSSISHAAPEAKSFESKTGGLVEMMEGLADRFRAKKKKS